MTQEKLNRFNYRGLLFYIISGLVLVICLEFGSVLLLQYSVRSQDKIASNINEAGRQRMIIRTLALYSDRYTHGDKNIATSLVQTYQNYVEAHKRLSSKNNISDLPSDFKIKIGKIYQDPVSGLNTLSEAYINKIKLLINAAPNSKRIITINNRIFEMSIGKLFSQTNTAVSIYEAALIKNKYNADIMKTYIFYVMSIVIFAEFVFIFLPVMRKAKISIDKVMELALLDPLTQLGNRTFFIHQTKKSMSTAKRSGTNLAIFYIDLDDFKDINDAFGTELGDLLLKKVAERLMTVSREQDTLVRLGGDDFALIIDRVSNVSNIAIIAERYLEALTQPFILTNNEVKISLSIGIAVYPYAAKSVDDLMTRADTALYRAKRLGKNKYAFYTDSLHQESQRRSKIEMALKNALRNGEFQLFYQPQINIKDCNIIGCEALIRWNNKTLGDPSPAEFIPIAEVGNYIFEIGNWVLKQALEDLCFLQEKNHLDTFKMSINLSAKELFNKEFLSEKNKILEQYSEQKNNITFELTETSVLQDINQAKKILNQLEAQGSKIALDDFGTGYSSLKYLKILPFSIIKIDKSFVKDINIDQNDTEIIKAMIKLSQALNFNLIAEGVETREQLAFMKQHHCAIIQGYIFSKPLTIQDLQSYIEKKSYREILKCL